MYVLELGSERIKLSVIVMGTRAGRCLQSWVCEFFAFVLCGGVC